jgi:hypothetical protein
LIALREKLFPNLSEDAWILLAAGYGERTGSILLSNHDRFRPGLVDSKSDFQVPLKEWQQWNRRLRPFLIGRRARQIYLDALQSPGVVRMADVARTSIGYVTGANDFFHLRPSEARRLKIPDRFLMPTVRNSRYLGRDGVTRQAVDSWMGRDDPVLLLRLTEDAELPKPVRDYLHSAAALEAKKTYKCRVRSPWYVVPDVRVPDGFLSYMSGGGPTLLPNLAGCCCTNSVHAVTLNNRRGVLSSLLPAWKHPLVPLSAEIEGHPLGGGMLKLEPREAARIALPTKRLPLTSADLAEIQEATATLRRWRHYE